MEIERSAGKGRLFLCATPIGNMRDVTLRVLDTLQVVDVIAAEDTRRTRKLLSSYGIRARLMSYREENRESAGKKIIEMLEDGRKVALVSDAGMPGISDPGSHLVQECVKRGIPVEALPGASAVLLALIISGLPTNRFAFEGFLPRKKGQRRKVLLALERDERTLVFFESPRRIRETLEDMRDVLGERKIALVRELTKKFESVYRGTISEVLKEVGETPKKGEYVIVVGGRSPDGRLSRLHEALSEAKRLMEAGFSMKEAVRIVAALKEGLSRSELYEAALKEFKHPEGT